jgi:DNA-binding protein H-NS
MASKRTRFTYAEDRQLIQMAAASATLEKAAARFGTSVETIERKAKSLQLTSKKRGGHKRLSPRLDPWPKARGTPERRPYPKVHPKFRNPKPLHQTWSGRGLQPRWVRGLLAVGSITIDDLRIDRS